MAKDDRATGIVETESERRPRQTVEPESLMSIEEYGATNAVNRTLFAGFVQYCKIGKVPPRLTARQWTAAMTTWRNAPVTS